MARGLRRPEGAWEQQYAEAHARWEAHKTQVEEAAKADVEAGEVSSYSSEDAAAEDGAPAAPTPTPGDVADGSLASDEALQALREKLTGRSVTARLT